MFSPKVLDRANVIEFNEVFLNGGGTGTLGDSFVLEDPDCRGLFLTGDRAFASNDDFEEAKGDVQGPLQGLVDILKPHHLHFGYRTINEISRFVSLTRRTVHPFIGDEALDIQILQKILPSFHGTRRSHGTAPQPVLSSFAIEIVTQVRRMPLIKPPNS